MKRDLAVWTEKYICGSTRTSQFSDKENMTLYFAARFRFMRKVIKRLLARFKGRSRSEDLDIDGWIILSGTKENWVAVRELD
jgi:hypothetical protein